MLPELELGFRPRIQDSARRTRCCELGRGLRPQPLFAGCATSMASHSPRYGTRELRLVPLLLRLLCVALGSDALGAAPSLTLRTRALPWPMPRGVRPLPQDRHSTTENIYRGAVLEQARLCLRSRLSFRSRRPQDTPAAECYLGRQPPTGAHSQRGVQRAAACASASLRHPLSARYGTHRTGSRVSTGVPQAHTACVSLGCAHTLACTTRCV